MQFCNQCGTEMNDGAKFCPKCGAVSAQPQAPQYTQPNAGQSFNAPGFNSAPNYNNNEQQAQGQPQQGEKQGNFFTNLLNTPDYTAQYDPQDIEQNKVVSVIAYFSILFWLPLVANSNSRYGRFHANQALISLIASAAFGIVSAILQVLFRSLFVSEIKYFGIGTGVYETNGFGLFLAGFFGLILSLPSLAWLILGIINSLNGRAKELPIIGKFRIIK